MRAESVPTVVWRVICMTVLSASPSRDQIRPTFGTQELSTPLANSGPVLSTSGKSSFVPRAVEWLILALPSGETCTPGRVFLAVRFLFHSVHGPPKSVHSPDPERMG